MTKAEIINAIHEEVGFSKNDAALLLDEFLQAIGHLLHVDGSVSLRNFGSFKVQRKKSRVGRNPKTKEEFLIRSRNVVLFKPSSNLKKYLNEDVTEND